jgi:hypothetical protein
LELLPCQHCLCQRALSKLSEKSAEKSGVFEAPTLVDAAQLCGISAIVGYAIEFA